jgi:hypothetical protein
MAMFIWYSHILANRACLQPNFSFMNCYKGAIDTKSVFLGGVITSASSGRNQSVIAVPVFSKASNNNNNDNNNSSLLLGVGRQG